MNTTLTPEQIKAAIDETITNMESFVDSMGYDNLVEFGRVTWTGDGEDYTVNPDGWPGTTISTNVYHEGKGDALAEIRMRLNEDGTLDDDTLYLYVDLPDEFL